MSNEPTERLLDLAGQEAGERLGIQPGGRGGVIEGLSNLIVKKDTLGESEVVARQDSPVDPEDEAEDDDFKMDSLDTENIKMA